MSKSNENDQKSAKVEEAAKEKFNKKNGKPFIQDSEQNKQIHKAALGPNTKR